MSLPRPLTACGYLGGLLPSADAEDDAQSHRPLTSVVKLGPESSSSGQKFTSDHDEQQLLVQTDDSQQVFSDPDPVEVPKAPRPVTVDTKSTSEVPAGPGSPAEPGDPLGKPGTCAASSLSALPNLHLQLKNNFSPGGSDGARLHLPKPSSEDGSGAAEPLTGGSGEGPVKASTLTLEMFQLFLRFCWSREGSLS